MREGSLVPDKQKESPKFAEGITIMDHFIFPQQAVLY